MSKNQIRFLVVMLTFTNLTLMAFASHHNETFLIWLLFSIGTAKILYLNLLERKWEREE